MAKLTAAGRKALPNNQYAGPGRSYPINDRIHAEKAIQLAPRGVKAGNISKATEQKIVAKAKAKLAKSK
jgi:hypothetical protein